MQGKGKGKGLAILCHVLGLLGCYFTFLGGFIFPLVVWAIFKNNRPLLEQHGKEATNFQFSLIIYVFILAVVFFISGGDALVSLILSNDNASLIASAMQAGMICIASVILIPLLGIFELLCVIVAIVNAANEKEHHYPLTIRLIK